MLLGVRPFLLQKFELNEKTVKFLEKAAKMQKFSLLNSAQEIRQKMSKTKVVVVEISKGWYVICVDG